MSTESRKVFLRRLALALGAALVLLLFCLPLALGVRAADDEWIIDFVEVYPDEEDGPVFSSARVWISGDHVTVDLVAGRASQALTGRWEGSTGLAEPPRFWTLDAGAVPGLQDGRLWFDFTNLNDPSNLWLQIIANYTTSDGPYSFSIPMEAVAWEHEGPEPEATETPPPLPTAGRTVTLQGRVYVVDPAWRPLSDALLLPLMEVPVSLMRGSQVLDFTFSKPPDGSFAFEVPITDNLVLSTTLLHAVTAPSAFKVVYDQADPAIWIATSPFSLDESSPETVVKDINLSLSRDLTAGPVPVPADRIDDVGLVYHYAREAWQMAAILLGQTLDLPTLKISAFSTAPDVTDTAYWSGPMAGFAPIDPVIELSPKYSDFSATAAAETVMHEFGHHLMADTYGNFLPYASGDTNHDGFSNPTTTDSWAEGFASFYALWTKKEEILAPAAHLWHNLKTVDNLELNYLAWSADEELAVTSLLWDLIDPASKQDLTEMPVANFATSPVVTNTGATTWYRDYIQLDRAELWRMISDAALASADRSPAAPQGYNYIYDVKQLYDTLQLNGVGLASPLTDNGLDALDELFIAHGFFDDTKPQNLAWDPGEEIGVTSNGAMTVGQISFPARNYRRSPPPVANSYFDYQVQDSATGSGVQVADFLVEVEFEPPYEAYNYSYNTRAWSPGQLQYKAPPANYPATTRITASGPGVESSTELQFTNQQYWQMRDQAPIGPLMAHTFEVQTSGDTGAPDPWSGGLEPDSGIGWTGDFGDDTGGIAPSTQDGLLLPLLCCGGGAALLVIGAVVVIGARSRKRRRAQAPSPRPARRAKPVAPASPPPALPPAAADYVTCPHCGAAASAGGRFCKTCGGSLAPEPAAAATCPHCGSPVQPHFEFCVTCGGSLAPAKPGAALACPRCGQPAKPGTRFCGSCGARL
jgi:DNA-directed RNA polymerase subunit RPC12/RpoP